MLTTVTRASILWLSFTSLSWAQGMLFSCEQRSETAYHGARIWHEMGRPANLSADMLGLIKGEAEHKLVLQAFAGLDAGDNEAAVKQRIKSACGKIPPADFQREQSFFEEDGNTPAHLTSCATFLSNMFDLYTLPKQEIVESIAVYPGPETERWVSAMLSLRAQGKTVKVATSEIFAQCQSSAQNTREALAKEIYAE